MASNFTNLKTKTMTKEDFIEILDKYDSDFNLETGETIQAIYFQDFGKLAEELVKLFAIHNVVGRSEQLESGLTCMMCRKPKQNDGHTCCEECAGLAF